MEGAQMSLFFREK